MDLGFANTDFYSGDINFIDLVGENYWLIPLEGITIDGQKTTPGGNAAIDTYVHPSLSFPFPRINKSNLSVM